MIEKLALKKGLWPILALDHGLTNYDGAAPVSAIPSLISACSESIGSVVMTYGFAKWYAKETLNLPVIVQCFGGPMGHPKVQICNPDEALNAGARGVAVQVDFSLERAELLGQIQSISRLVCSAHKNDLPVLFMIAPQEYKDFEKFAEPIRFCHELGAELIKIRCDTLLFEEKEDLGKFKEFLDFSPPVLLAGGEKHENVILEMMAAKNLGFSGFCIGRNIYQDDSPRDMAHNLIRVWYD